MKNILVITYWSFKSGLTESASLPYVRMIAKNLSADSKFFFVTLENPSHKTENPEFIQSQLLNEKTEWYPLNYYPFGWKAFFTWSVYLILLTKICFTKKIRFVHCFCTPAGAIGYLLSVITQKPLILDMYEPHAESMVENGTWKRNSVAYKFLSKLEKLQTKRAQNIISATSGYINYVTEKWKINSGKFFVKPTCVDFGVFKKRSDEKNKKIREKLNLTNKLVCLYVGKFGGIYLAQEVFDFLKAAHTYWGEKFRALVVTDISRNEIEQFAENSQLDKNRIVSFSGFIDREELINYMSIADFAITPVKPVPSKKYCSPVKNGEYWAMGLPVVITKNISDDSEIIKENNIGAVIETLDTEGYFQAIRKIDEIIHSKDIKLIKEKIFGIASQYRDIGIADEIYRSIYL